MARRGEKRGAVVSNADELVTTARRETICMARIKLGHETVQCTADHKVDEPHCNRIYGVWPPCLNCGGLEEHGPTCPTPELVGRADTWAVVTWVTGGKPRVQCGKRAR